MEKEWEERNKVTWIGRNGTNDGFVREKENAQGELFTFYIFYDDDTDILLTN